MKYGEYLRTQAEECHLNKHMCQPRLPVGIDEAGRGDEIA
jgi:hypothetical protein